MMNAGNVGIDGGGGGAAIMTRMWDIHSIRVCMECDFHDLQVHNSIPDVWQSSLHCIHTFH